MRSPSVRSVLIVDDDPLVRELLGEVLGSDAFDLRFAADGPTALQEVEDDLPDLVLLDVMMPGMDGFEVCRRLRSVHPHLQIVILTARVGRDQEAAALAAGADAFLAKPFSPLALREFIDREPE